MPRTAKLSLCAWDSNEGRDCVRRGCESAIGYEELSAANFTLLLTVRHMTFTRTSGEFFRSACIQVAQRNTKSSF